MPQPLQIGLTQRYNPITACQPGLREGRSFMRENRTLRPPDPVFGSRRAGWGAERDCQIVHRQSPIRGKSLNR